MVRRNDTYSSDAFDAAFENENATQTLHEVPLNGFFNDELYTLVYLSPTSENRQLNRLRSTLMKVTDDKNTILERIDCALYLANRVLARSSTYSTLTKHDVIAAQGWLTYAIELGNAPAAVTLSQLNLALEGLEIYLSPDSYSLPVLKRISEEPRMRLRQKPSWDVCKSWYDGARLALRHLDDNFSDCDLKSLEAMMLCMLCFIMHTPDRQQLPRYRYTQAIHPIDCIDWLVPLWASVAEAAALKTSNPELNKNKYAEQFQAARLALQIDTDERSISKAVNECHDWQPRQSGAIRDIIVIRTVIAQSTDRDEKTQLEFYERLRYPIGMTPMPASENLLNTCKILTNEFPWAQEAIKNVMSELLARAHCGVNTLGMSPLLLVGPPGSGKTRFAQRLGDLLEAPNTFINMAGMCDVKLLKGVTRGWSGARPSRIIEFIAQTSGANPLFVLDEIDKSGQHSSNGGDPQEALLDLLESRNASRYQDVYLMAECDLSHCLYIATCNSLKPLNKALLSRLRIVFFPMPDKEHSMAILDNLLRETEKAWGLPSFSLSLRPWEQTALTGLAPRQMRQALIDLLGATDDETARLFIRH